MIGRVSLVGSGPGDPGLLTIKAMKRIAEADLVIYDFLANPEHLRHKKPAAQTLCVGKRFRHQPFSQKKINQLILKAARSGQYVVRLKGGDPYLFGRGGEEALFLYEHKIPFEVVPGVTSATACAAYSGIPLTHREHNASVTFLTGHRASDKNLSSLEWDKIASIGGTLVIYMGFYNLKKITERLIGAGLSPVTPASVIEWGTLPKQRSCSGTLTDIAKKVQENNLSAPAIIIIGEVVRLKEKLSWFEKLPFFGQTIVVTRMKEKSGALREKLEEWGASVLEFPVVEIQPLTSFSQLDNAINDATHYDWLVFTSSFGVDAFFGRAFGHHKKDARFTAALKIASVGPETSKMLRAYGILPDLEPKRFEAAAIADEFASRSKDLSRRKILLLRTDIAPPLLEERLKKMGAHVHPVTVYKTRLPKKIPPEFKKAVFGGEVNMVTFTSSSTVNNFMKILGAASLKKMAKKIKFASIGPVTSETLRNYGFEPSCEAKISTIEGLVEAMKNMRLK